MDSAVFQQLLELTQGFNKIGLKPVICGGLGLYLLFRDRPKDPEDIRTTTDIDLMIPSSQACNEVERNAIAELITEELQYVVREDGRHFRFIREQTHQLDILTPPTDGVVTEGGRVKLVRTKLHGRLTPEACFIGEDLRKVELAGPTFNPPQPSAVVNVPSPTNMLGPRPMLTTSTSLPGFPCHRIIGKAVNFCGVTRHRMWCRGHVLSSQRNSVPSNNQDGGMY
jgi:hypothetical protein